jgi:MoaA/NifB/PqqE/SkfB family radical SAM enzyme
MCLQMSDTKQNVLFNYINGNAEVTIFDDGSKIRSFEGDLNLVHPESLDVKITNFCTPEPGNGICSFCHESSSLKGLHGNLNELLKILKPLPPGVEIAIGGGDPMSHPELITFLGELKDRGIIANITINQKHIQKNKDLILNLINERLIYGVGISYSSSRYHEDIRPIIQVTNNVVFHVIMGVNSVSDIDELFELCQQESKTCKILVLGYKTFGFGINYYLKNKTIENNKYRWYVELASYFKKSGLVVSFDNLSINQLNLKRFFTNEAWNKFYMGQDGSASMYIDAVEQQYAMSSTSSDRVYFKDKDLISFFHFLK